MRRRDDSGDFYVYFCSDNVAPSNEAIYIAFVVKPKFILPICGCVMILQRRAVESKHNLENSQCHRRYIQHNTALCCVMRCIFVTIPISCCCYCDSVLGKALDITGRRSTTVFITMCSVFIFHEADEVRHDEGDNKRTIKYHMKIN